MRVPTGPGRRVVPGGELENVGAVALQPQLPRYDAAVKLVARPGLAVLQRDREQASIDSDQLIPADRYPGALHLHGVAHFWRSISNGMPPNWVSAVIEVPLMTPSRIRAGSPVGVKSIALPVRS